MAELEMEVNALGLAYARAERAEAERVVLTSAETAAALAGMQARAERAEASAVSQMAQASELARKLATAKAAIARVEAWYRKWDGYDQYVQSVLDECWAALRGEG